MSESGVIRVGATVEVAVGPRRGCVAVVERLHPTRLGSSRRFWWLTPLTEDEPLGYYETGELILTTATPPGEKGEA